jgi:transposase
MEATILRLSRVEKWPVGTIAAQLGVHRDVVDRVLVQAGMPRPLRLRASRIDAFVPFLQEAWAKHPRLAASRLYRMCVERGYVGSPDHFRHAVARYRPARPVEAFLRLRTLPGEQAQVDWAHFGHRTVGRATRPLMAFVMVLSYSRAVFLRFTFAMRMAEFMRCHQEAFAYFQGAVRVCMYDNLKSAVLERVGDAIRFNEQFLDFAAHQGFEVRPAAPGRGNEKGRVERTIRYARGDCYMTHEHAPLDVLNREADLWCRGPVLTRQWAEDDRRTVGEVFAEERRLLLPLPANPYPVAERCEVSVGKTPYVRFDGNDYSVPHTHVRKTLTVLATENEVRVLDGAAEVARHARTYDRGQQVEDPAHVEALVAMKRHARRHRGMDRLTHAAPSSRQILERLAERGTNLGQATLQFLKLLETYGAEALERAAAEVLARDVPHVHAVRQVLERERAARGEAPALPIPLPDQARNLVVRPHDLEGYDTLAKPAPEEPPENEHEQEKPDPAR